VVPPFPQKIENSLITHINYKRMASPRNTAQTREIRPRKAENPWELSLSKSFMAMASTSLHQSLSPKYPHLFHNSRFPPTRLRFTSLRFPSTIRATSAVSLEPVKPSSLVSLFSLFVLIAFCFFVLTLNHHCHYRFLWIVILNYSFLDTCELWK